MSKDLTKLHYQMLRKTTSGETIDGALSELKTKIQGDSVQPGEPVVIFYDDTSGNTGAHLAVPTSGITAGDEEGYMFPNRREVFERMEEDEEVTTAALIDLDDRINTVSGDLTTLREEFDNMGSDFAEIKLTKDVRALVDAGAIKTNTTVSAGTSFTAFVEQLLLEEKDWTAVVPKISVSSTGTTPIEVGSNLELSFSNTKTDGQFQSSFSGNVTANVSWGAVEYHVTSGSVTYNTNNSSYTVSGVAEGDYVVTASAPYTGVTATSKGLAKNNGNPTSVAISDGTAHSTNSQTYKAQYKAFLGGTSATTANEFNLAEANIDVQKFLPQTSGSVDLASGNWKSNGKNIFVLTTGTLSHALDALSGTELKQDFTPVADYTYTNNGMSKTYHLYLYIVNGGAKMEFREITVTR